MKTPIEPRDILKGDLIRVEHTDGQSTLSASEYVAKRDEHSWMAWCDSPHFLLDRPTPPVELPTGGNHLGWLTDEMAVGRPDRTLLVFNFDRIGGVEDTSYGQVARSVVTAWEPAVAVPASALDELREHAKGGATFSPINTFLAAVDAANGDAS